MRDKGITISSGGGGNDTRRQFNVTMTLPWSKIKGQLTFHFLQAACMEQAKQCLPFALFCSRAKIIYFEPDNPRG